MPAWDIKRYSEANLYRKKKMITKEMGLSRSSVSKIDWLWQPLFSWRGPWLMTSRHFVMLTVCLASTSWPMTSSSNASEMCFHPPSFFFYIIYLFDVIMHNYSTQQPCLECFSGYAFTSKTTLSRNIILLFHGIVNVQSTTCAQQVFWSQAWSG